MKVDKTIHIFVHPVHGVYWYTKVKLCKKFSLDHVEVTKLLTGVVQSYQNWRVVTK